MAASGLALLSEWCLQVAFPGKGGLLARMNLSIVVDCLKIFRLDCVEQVLLSSLAFKAFDIKDCLALKTAPTFARYACEQWQYHALRYEQLGGDPGDLVKVLVPLNESLKQKAKVPHNPCSEAFTLLHLLAAFRLSKTARFLLQSKSATDMDKESVRLQNHCKKTINAFDLQGKTPLVEAVKYGCADVVGVLIQEGADPDQGAEFHPDWTPLLLKAMDTGRSSGLW
jgi:hypothetical protein